MRNTGRYQNVSNGHGNWFKYDIAGRISDRTKCAETHIVTVSVSTHRRRVRRMSG
jgi:hypothetical protein